MSVSYIPDKTKFLLWGKAAGRCEYEGCPEKLYVDKLTKAEFNIAYIAHIIADKPDGPRGDQKLSEKLRANIDNLMILCDSHHRLIDKEDVEGHPVQRLKEMKEKHEKRIDILGSITESKQSHVILYGANIGEQFARPKLEEAAFAMIPNMYPAEKPALEISIRNSALKDTDPLFWQVEQTQLERQFNDRIKPKLAHGEIDHFSIFAFAPMPLLIKLGQLLSDIPVAEVYQKHREPANWFWQDVLTDYKYEIKTPENKHETVALVLSLSATINHDRVQKVLGNDISIWTMTLNKIDRDFLKARYQLQQFREQFRTLLDEIKAIHGHDSLLHVFPAVPVAIAVEIGRVWMPKADLSLIIYDENKAHGGFKKAIEI